MATLMKHTASDTLRKTWKRRKGLQLLPVQVPFLNLGRQVLPGERARLGGSEEKRRTARSTAGTTC